MCKSIHHMGSDRASCRMRIALGKNHRGSGVTLKARVTWGAVIDSACMASSTPVDKPGQGPKLSALGDVKSGYPPVVFRGNSRTMSWLLAFQSEVHPNRAALQSCLETRVREQPALILQAHPRLNAPWPFGKAVTLSPTGWANSCGVTWPDLLASM